MFTPSILAVFLSVCFLCFRCACVGGVTVGVGVCVGVGVGVGVGVDVGVGACVKCKGANHRCVV